MYQLQITMLNFHIIYNIILNLPFFIKKLIDKRLILTSPLKTPVLQKQTLADP